MPKNVHKLCVWCQALVEAAADAAEEEERRLQTQTELQDRYLRDLERERLVRLRHFGRVAGSSQVDEITSCFWRVCAGIYCNFDGQGNIIKRNSS